MTRLLVKINNVHIIITEGYKRENKPKLEVFRTEAAECLLCEDHELFGLVTDVNFDKDVPQFSFSKIEKLVDHIVELFLNK